MTSRPPLLSTDEVAEYLALPTDRVRLFIRQREIPAMNVGTPRHPVYRVRQDDLDAWLKRRTLS